MANAPDQIKPYRVVVLAGFSLASIVAVLVLALMPVFPDSQSAWSFLGPFGLAPSFLLAGIGLGGGGIAFGVVRGNRRVVATGFAIFGVALIAFAAVMVTYADRSRGTSVFWGDVFNGLVWAGVGVWMVRAGWLRFPTRGETKEGSPRTGPRD